jgi:hypothetical protein
MSYSEPEKNSTVEQLLGAIAILALLTAMFAWGSYVTRNDERALRELAAQRCAPDAVVYVRPDGSGEPLCMGGSGRVKR